MLECVINISEGRHVPVVTLIALRAEAGLLDVHTDWHHNRSVLTLAGADVVNDACAVAEAAVAELDIATHRGVHPRLGVVDVVPFVPLPHTTATMDDALAARDRFAELVADVLGVPCFLFGPERSLPDIRRGAFRDLLPDLGPREPHPSAGAMCVGARPVLVAYNLWLSGVDLATARRIAAGLRGPAVRALAFDAGGIQVSCNLIEPDAVGPAAIYDRVATTAAIVRAELVGLVPDGVLAAVPPTRWDQLGLQADRTIEARLESAGLDGGSFG